MLSVLQNLLKYKTHSLLLKKKKRHRAHPVQAGEQTCLVTPSETSSMIFPSSAQHPGRSGVGERRWAQKVHGRINQKLEISKADVLERRVMLRLGWQEVARMKRHSIQDRDEEDQEE